jgi:large subunit ribosomal protein L25
LTLPKGVKVVTHGKVNPVIISVVAIAAEEEAAPAATADAKASAGKDAKAAPAKAPAKK